MQKRLLVIVTNAKVLHLTDGTEHPSGYWAEEFAVPYSAFRKAGYECDIATIDGITPTVDASSLNPDAIKWVVPQGVTVDVHAEAKRYSEIIEGASGLARPRDLNGIDRAALDTYKGVYIAGGHGCMTDMPSSYQMARLLLRALDARKPIASVCHGPTAFLAPRDADGHNPFSGYHFTCFSQMEETITPIWKRLPMVLQYELEAQGLLYSRAEQVWGSHVVHDRNLITGQNPYSSKALADQFLRVLQES